MGWRSTIVVMHDFLHEIGRDPTFGRTVERACLAHPDRAPYGDHFTVIEKNHADANSVLLVHDYHGRYLCSAPNNGDMDALRALADKLGYRLVKKPGAP